MPRSVFISYSRKDAGLVTPVVALIRAANDWVFLDTLSVQPGKRWREQIEASLNEAELIVVFWCSHSSGSAEVALEYKLGIERGKDVLPILLDATPLSPELAPFQGIDFRGLVGGKHRRYLLPVFRLEVVFALLFVCLASWYALRYNMSPLDYNIDDGDLPLSEESPYLSFLVLTWGYAKVALLLAVGLTFLWFIVRLAIHRRTIRKWSDPRRQYRRRLKPDFLFAAAVKVLAILSAAAAFAELIVYWPQLAVGLTFLWFIVRFAIRAKRDSATAHKQMAAALESAIKRKG